MTIRYLGFSYEQASREASRLIARYGWYKSLDKLNELKTIMDRYSK